MKAYVLRDIGDMSLKEVKKPVPGEGEVIVRVRASGICGSDIPRIYADGAHKMPVIPGHEFSGEVTEVGRKADERLLYKRVGVFPLIPCGRCAACRKGKYELCRDYSYLGSRRDGGFAEYAAVPAANVTVLPDSVTYEEAAMLEPMAVAVHAMRRVLPCREDRKERVAVCGLGSIGLLLVMFLKEAGYQDIYVIGNKDYQRECVKKAGVMENSFCDSRKENVREWLMERTNGGGADVFFECVGKNETVSQAIDLTGAAGSVCLVGNPYGDMVLKKGVYWKILRNQLTVTGTWNSSFTGDEGDDWNYVIKRLKEKRIDAAGLIVHRFPLEGLTEGFGIMKDKTEDYIKIMGIFGY